MIGELTALDSRSALSGMPAFASAKSGTITKLVHGCSASCTRSFGETADQTLSRALRASSRRRLLAEQPDKLRDLLELVAGRRVGGRREPDREAGDRRMHARGVQRQPHARADQVQRQPADGRRRTSSNAPNSATAIASAPMSTCSL